MIARLLERGLWSAAAAGLLSGAVSWRHAGAAARVEEPPAVAASVPPEVSAVDAQALSQAAGVIADGNLFRPGRRPADSTAGPPTGVPPTPAPMLQRPQLVVRGLLGPPWAAVLEGVPGREGSVLVRAGDVIGALRVRAVHANRVVVQGMDTTWTLAMDRP